MNTERTSLFYMANLGSEITRALSAYQAEDYEKMHGSIGRIKAIMGKIEKLPEMHGRTGELQILKSIIEDLSNKNLKVDKDQLMDYFSPFAERLMSA